MERKGRRETVENRGEALWVGRVVFFKRMVSSVSVKVPRIELGGFDYILYFRSSIPAPRLEFPSRFTYFIPRSDELELSEGLSRVQD